MAGGTQIIAFADSEFRMRYRETYLTAGLNAKDMAKTRGLYRGFALAINVADLSVTVTADPTVDDHLAVYHSADEYALTVRRTGGDFPLNLAPAAGSTVYIAIYAAYALSTVTEANIRMYTQAEWDANPPEKGEVLVLGKVVVPASGKIPAANISATYRTLPADTKSQGERSWRNLIQYGDLRGVQEGTSTVFFPSQKMQIPGIELRTGSSIAEVKVDRTDGISSGTSFAFQWLAQGTGVEGQATIQTWHLPLKQDARLKLRFWFKVVEDPTAANGQEMKFTIFYTDSSGSFPSKVISFYPENYSASSDWALFEEEFGIADLAIIRKVTWDIDWTSPGSVYPTPGNTYLRIADLQLLLEDEQGDTFGKVTDQGAARFFRELLCPQSNPPGEYDPTIDGVGAGVTSYFDCPNLSGSAFNWRSVLIDNMGQVQPTTPNSDQWGLGAPWILAGTRLVGENLSELPRYRALYHPDSEMTLLLEPIHGTVNTDSYSHVFMGSYADGNNLWFVTNALWDEDVDEWVQQTAGKSAFAVVLPEYDANPMMRWRYKSDSFTSWTKGAWSSNAWLGVHDETNILWELQMGVSVRLGEDAVGSRGASLLMGDVAGTPHVKLVVEDDSGNYGELVLGRAGYPDRAILTSKDATYGEGVLSLEGGAARFQKNRLVLDNDEVLYNDLTGGLCYADLQGFVGSSATPLNNHTLYGDNIVFAWFIGSNSGIGLVIYGAYNIDTGSISGDTYSWTFDFLVDAESEYPVVVCNSANDSAKLYPDSVSSEDMTVAFADMVDGSPLERVDAAAYGLIHIIVMNGPLHT